MEARKILVGLLVTTMLFSVIGATIAYDANSPYDNIVSWEIASDTAFSVAVAAGETYARFEASRNDTNVEPHGQSDGTPIFTVTNTGNTNLDFKCNLTAAKPSWAIIKVNDEYVNSTADTFDTTLVTFNATVPATHWTPMYLWTNTSNAASGTTNRTLNIWSVAS